MSVAWDDVVAFGLTLPGTERATSYGRPALKVRGKAFVIDGKQADHFVLMSTADEVEVLMETDPACFFQTPHYRGYPIVLVRYAAADRERIVSLVERAWAARASAAHRKARAAAEEEES